MVLSRLKRNGATTAITSIRYTTLIPSFVANKETFYLYPLKFPVMNISLKKWLIPAIVLVLAGVYSFTAKSQAAGYDYMIVEYNDNTNELSTSITSGAFSTRNVKSLLLDRNNDRTPFLNEVKTQERNGWEVHSYAVTSLSSANYYSCMLRKPAS